MKTHLLIPYFMAACLATGAHAQEKISAIRTSRIEVTERLDAQITPEMHAFLAPYKVAVDSVMAPVVGMSRVGMSAGWPESLLGNWAADVLKWGAQANDSLPEADFGLMNLGGLRNNIPKDTVRQGDIMLVSPFNNYLTVVELTGDVVTEVMRDIAKAGGVAVSHEVKLVIGADNQLKSATVSGEPIDPQRTYRMATISYLAEGNDGMDVLKKATEKHVSGQLTTDVMLNWVKAHGIIDAKMEGRIVVTE